MEQPTDWCAGMVVIPKPNGKVRMCVDLTKLNESVRLERHPLPSVDRVLAQLSGATIFSKLDANSGFWQVPLSPDSALLTTFITPTQELSVVNGLLRGNRMAIPSSLRHDVLKKSMLATWGLLNAEKGPAREFGGLDSQTSFKSL